jgi:5-methylcytosine-specific restriction protein A
MEGMPTLARRRDNTGSSNKQGGNFREIYQSHRWHSQSALFLKKNPLCRRCLAEGKTERAQVTDHVIPLVIWVTIMGKDPFDQSNWQPLSKRCHSIKTKEERKK